MRRLLVLAVTLVAVLGVLAPPAIAQAPAPKVTITGFIDEVGTWGKNLSDYDNNYNRQKDTQATGRTPAQVLLRWCLQRDAIVLPKSVHRERIEENSQVFDFSLSEEDMHVLDGFDRTGGTDEAREQKWW